MKNPNILQTGIDVVAAVPKKIAKGITNIQFSTRGMLKAVAVVAPLGLAACSSTSEGWKDGYIAGDQVPVIPATNYVGAAVGGTYGAVKDTLENTGTVACFGTSILTLGLICGDDDDN